MAILGKIRQRSALLIGIIALALFAFLLSDLINGGTFNSGSRFVGSVNGQDITASDFSYKVALAEQQGMTGVQASNSVWEQEVKNILFADQFEKIGLKLGSERLMDVMKENPNFANNPQFLNSAGKFDESKFKEFIKTMLASNSDQKRQWEAFEKDVERMYTDQMYYTLIKAGLNTTKAEGKIAYEKENNKVDFDFVNVAYTTINDDQAKVSDDEIIAYMKENKKKFKSDKTADLQIVFIPNTPSKEDEAEMQKKLQSYLNGGVVYNEKTQKNDTILSFIADPNPIAFVNKNSDIKFDSTYIAKKDLPLDHQEKLFNLPDGQVYGPYLDNEYQKISKVIGRKANTSAKASHILIAYKGAMRADASVKRTKEEAKALADNLLQQVKSNPTNFPMLAMVNSDDPGSKQNGGEYDNIMPNQMVKPFNDFVFNSPIGSTGVVETEFGYHVIKVSDKYNSVLLATVANKVEPSEKTTDDNYAKAAKFESAVNEKDFEKTAKEMGLTSSPAPGIKAMDEYLPAVGAQRGIVIWAFNNDTSEGDVKQFPLSNGFAIVKLKGINDTGLLSVEIARPQVEPILKNKKKAEIIKKKMTGNTLEAVSKASNATIMNAADVTLANPMVPNVGPEPKVVGKAFALAPGKTSELIEGQQGVFMIRGKKVTKAPAIPNYNTQIGQIKAQSQGSASGRALGALKEKSDIDDKRF